MVCFTSYLINYDILHIFLDKMYFLTDILHVVFTPL